MVRKWFHAVQYVADHRHKDCAGEIKQGVNDQIDHIGLRPSDKPGKHQQNAENGSPKESREE